MLRYWLSPEIALGQSWQSGLLFWLQSLRHPALTLFMGFVTMLGDDLFYVLILTLFYWTKDRHGAFNLMRLVVLSSLLNAVIKSGIDAARPFEVFERLSGLWIFTAEGASFPSGHAQGAAVFWTYLATQNRNPSFKVAAAMLVALIALSRLYLGVHWPLDVLTGAGLGAAIGFFGKTLLRRYSRFLWAFTVLMAMTGVLVMKDHSAIMLTFVLLGATLGHWQAVHRQKTEQTPVQNLFWGQGQNNILNQTPFFVRFGRLILGIFIMAAAKFVTQWALEGIGLTEGLVSACASFAAGLAITWVVPVWILKQNDYRQT